MKILKEFKQFLKTQNIPFRIENGKIIVEVEGDLYLSSLTTLPENCSLTAGGYLDLSSLTTLPENCSLTAGGYLDLRSLTTLPENCSLTAGGYLYLSSLTTLPENCSLTAGGSLDLRSHLRSKVKIKPFPQGYIFTWQNGKYIKIDGILCEVLQKRLNSYKVKIVGRIKVSWLVTNGKFWAHGETLKKANEDLNFKSIAEKLKHEPIKADTVITVPYYRTVTGACEQGCRSWMQSNNISKEKIKAKDLLPLLEKTNAYGLSRFKQLVSF